MEATSSETLVALVHLSARLQVGQPMGDGEVEKTPCSQCKHRREHSTTHHILCAKPRADIEGKRRGIEKGWFMYPFMYDPVWRTNECKNFEPCADASSAVSPAVSHASQ